MKRRKSKLKPDDGDDPAVVRTMALDLLARREHSEQELLHKLLSRGFAAGVVGEAVSALVAEQLLDNARFTEAFVRSRCQRGQGPLKIRSGLHERGIDEGLIDRVLDEYATQWPELAARVRRKRFGTVLPADFRERARQMRFLQQRGFSPAQISAVFRGGE